MRPPDYRISSRVNSRPRNGFTGLSGMFEPGKNDKGLMRPIVGIRPSFTIFTERRVEKVAKKVVRVKRTRILRFQRARSLKFRKALEFISRETTQKVHNNMPISGGGGAKKSTYQERARGDNGQVKLQLDVR